MKTSTEEEPKTCKTCAYCHSFRPNYYCCRRFPPLLVDISTGYDSDINNITSYNIFPPINEDFWCGEWKEKDNP